MADTPHTPGSPDESLEARIVAMVVGEASDFERAELNEILATRPDMQEFARRIAAIHRLTEGALSDTAKKQGTEWQLAPEKRQALMEKFGAMPVGVSTAMGKQKPKAFGRKFWISMAACFAVLASSYVALQIVAYQGAMATLGSSGISGPTALDDQKNWFNNFGIAAAEKKQDQLSGYEDELDSGAFTGQLAQGLAIVPSEESVPSSAPPQQAASRLSRTAPVFAVPRRSDRDEVAGASQAQSAMTAARESQIQNFSEGWGRAAPSPEAPAPVRQLRANEVGKDKSDFEGFVKHRSPVDSLKPMAVADSRLQVPLPAATPASRAIPGERSRRLAPAQPLFESLAKSAPVSTFSLHVADVSFRLALTDLLQNRRPEPSRIRSEEFTAAFDYGDPAPVVGEAVSLAQDQSAHPFIPQSNLLRVSLRTAAEGRAMDEPLNLMVVLDKSGSMERLDRSMATANTLRALSSQLREQDRVTIVTFDRQARLVESAMPGNAAGERLLQIQRTLGESGTNIEEALDVALEVIGDQVNTGGAHRVLLITDGIANLGSTVPENIADSVRELRSRGVALDVVAVGALGVGDEILQELARHGDGRYFLMEDGNADAAALAQKLAGAFRPAARNVKVQVRLNPQRVSDYSLLGFKSHRLREEDFRDDSVDAAELAAAEQGSALYQLRMLPDGAGEVGEISVRFQEVATGRMVERSWVIPFQPVPPALDEATPAHQLAATATLTAEFLQQSPTGQLVRMEELEPFVTQLEMHFHGNTQINSLAQIVKAIRKLYTE